MVKYIIPGHYAISPKQDKSLKGKLLCSLLIHFISGGLWCSFQIRIYECACTHTHTDTQDISLGSDRNRQVIFWGTDGFKQIIEQKLWILHSLAAYVLKGFMSFFHLCQRAVVTFSDHCSLHLKGIFTTKWQIHGISIFPVSQTFSFLLLPLPPCSFLLSCWFISRDRDRRAQHNHKCYSAQEHA